MKRVKKTISDGDRGIDQTVAEMWRLIRRDVKNPELIRKAKTFEGKTKLDTIKRTFNYVAGMTYKSDPDGVEFITAPIGVIQGKAPHLDCDDMVATLAALLLANKIPVRIKTIAWRRQEYTHVILEAFYEGYWLPLDPVKGKSGFGDQIRKIIREKKYDDPMSRELVTLEDNCCGKRRKSDNENNNVILIGNQWTDMMRLQGGGRRPVQRYMNPPVQPKTEIKEKKVFVPQPYPVFKKVKTPLRVIATKPVTTYREFY